MLESPNSLDHRRPLRVTSRAHPNKEDTPVIEVVHFQSNQMVWEGAAAGALTDLTNPEDADEVVFKAVRGILAWFPPR